MASFSYMDSPYQHVPSTPNCFYKHDWTSPEAEVPQIQPSQSENEDGTSDYSVPGTPQLELATSLPRSYIKSAQEKKEIMKSPDIAPELKHPLFHASPQKNTVSCMSPFNYLMEQVVPGVKEDSNHQKFRMHCYRLCRSSKREMLLKSRLKKELITNHTNMSEVECQQSKDVPTVTRKLKLFEDGEIFV